MAKSDYDFQVFNHLRRIAREKFIFGFRNPPEFIDLNKSTFEKRERPIYAILEAHMTWPERGKKWATLDTMRISANPFYLLLKSRSMVNGYHYALHFALLDMLSGGNALALIEILEKISEGTGIDEQLSDETIDFFCNAGFLRCNKDETYQLTSKAKSIIATRFVGDEEQYEEFLARVLYRTLSKAKTATLPQLQSHILNQALCATWSTDQFQPYFDTGLLVYTAQKERCRLGSSRSKKLLEQHQDDRIAYEIERCLSGRLTLSKDELKKAFAVEAKKSKYYGIRELGHDDEPFDADESADMKRRQGKTTLLSRLDDYYCKLGCLIKNNDKTYSLPPTTLDALLARCPGLADAVSFYSEYSPLGIIGSHLMDKASIQNDTIVFKNHYIVQALDSLIIHELLLAIQRKSCVELYNEHRSQRIKAAAVVFPLKLLFSTESGRGYLYAYSFSENRYTSARMDSIYSVVIIPKQSKESKALFADVNQTSASLLAEGEARLPYVWTSCTGVEAFPMTVVFRNDESYLLDHIHRERRHGTVRITQDGMIEYQCAIFQPTDPVPWLMSYLGQIETIKLERGTGGQRNASCTKRLATHVEDLYRLYHKLPRCQFEKTAPYTPVARDHLPAESKHDTSLLFQATQSKYIYCIKRILERTRGHHSQEEITDIIREEKTRFGIGSHDQEISFESLVEAGMIQYHRDHQAFTRGVTEEDKRYEYDYCSFLIESGETMQIPLDETELRWLRAILDDEKINLFISREEVSGLKALLKRYQPLYHSDDILYLEQYLDGDTVSDPSFQDKFRVIQAAIRDKAELEIGYQSENEKRKGQQGFTYFVMPMKIEYSKQADKFQLIGMFTEDPPEGSSLQERYDSNFFSIRLSNIISIRRSADMKDRWFPPYAEVQCPEPLVLNVLNIYGAIERFMMTFSTYHKETEYTNALPYQCKDGKEYAIETCRVKLWYSTRDEREVFKKLRSFGRAVEVLAPAKVRRAFIKRVDRQCRIFLDTGLIRDGGIADHLRGSST